MVKDFFREYADITLPNGAPAKLAIYFPQTDDVEALRPAIEAALAGEWSTTDWPEEIDALIQLAQSERLERYLWELYP